MNAIHDILNAVLADNDHRNPTETDTSPPRQTRVKDGQKRMSVAEFRRLGYLREVNRCFLHPLGLALEVIADESGRERFGEVIDQRSNPCGSLYPARTLENKKAHTQARTITAEREEKAASRQARYGFVVQPYEHEHEPETPLHP